MYVSIDIASSGHVTHKGGHIKGRLASTFMKSSHHEYRTWAWASDECPMSWVIGDFKRRSEPTENNEQKGQGYLN